VDERDTGKGREMRLEPLFSIITGTVVAILFTFIIIRVLNQPSVEITIKPTHQPQEPQAKVGNCYEHDKELEDWENMRRDIIKIARIGRKSYGIHFWFFDTSSYAEEITTLRVQVVDRLYIKEVPCPIEGQYYE